MKRWELYLEIFMEIILGAFVLLAVVFLFPKLLGFLWPFVAGWIIALIANPLRWFLEKKIKLPKKFGSAFIIIFVLSLIVAGIYMISIKLGTELKGFISEVPNIYDKIMYEFSSFNQWINDEFVKYGVSNDILQKADELYTTIQGEVGAWVKSIGTDGVKYAGTFAKGVTNGIVSTIMMILSAYFFMVEREELMEIIAKKTSSTFKDRVNMIKDNIVSAVGGYCKAQVKIMGVIFVILLIGLLIAGENYAFLLAVLICLLDILPFFGTGTALIPWAVFCFIDNRVQQAVILIITYLICLLARQLIQPKIIADSVGLRPLPTLLLMYIGLKLGGLLGFIFAVVIGIIVLNLYKIGMFSPWIRRIQRRVKLLKDIE